MRVLGLVLCVSFMVGCAGGQASVRPEQLRAKLRAALQEPVATREKRDEQSRLMEDIVEQNALDDMNREEIRAALGKGRACRVELCSANGFSESDWYYEVGVAQSDDIKQLPVLIIGFDPRDRAVRVWTLTTH